jgi:predicted PilT family ATPase
MQEQRNVVPSVSVTPIVAAQRQVRRCPVKNIPCITDSVIYHEDTKDTNLMFSLRILRVFVVSKNA